MTKSHLCLCLHRLDSLVGDVVVPEQHTPSRRLPWCALRFFHVSPATSGKFNFTSSRGMVAGGALEDRVALESGALGGAR